MNKSQVNLNVCFGICSLWQPGLYAAMDHGKQDVKYMAVTEFLHSFDTAVIHLTQEIIHCIT